MKRGARDAAVGGVILLCLFAGWRLAAQLGAQERASVATAAGVASSSTEPAAMLSIAEGQLRAGDTAAAAATARRLLAREPLQGEAFRILAQVAERTGKREEALRLYTVAATRAPRDLPARVWLTQHFIEQGDYRRAVSHIDKMLRLAPTRARRVFPVLVQLSQDRRFADELARALAEAPAWRSAFLASLRRPGQAEAGRVASGRIIEALRRQGQLADDDYAQWLDSLMADGRWGEAFARWSGLVPKPGGRLPLLYNGDFASLPSNSGFDWRTKRTPGVLLRVESAPGATASAAYLRFMDRGVAEAGLSHPLFLAPGDYEVRLRTRASGLRSAIGLQWRVHCAGNSRVLARIDVPDGSYAWRDAGGGFTVPARGCEGQWLRLVNPVASGSGQRIGGEYWLDDARVVRLSAP